MFDHRGSLIPVNYGLALGKHPFILWHLSIKIVGVMLVVMFVFNGIQR